MALTPEVRSSQAGALALTGGEGAAAPDINVSQVAAMALGIFPTEELRVSSVGTLLLVDEHSKDVNVSQATTMVLALGRIKDPNVRAWTFTLDGHDFYVLAVGDEETLVYDASTGEWATWGSDDLDIFQGKVGINWTGSGSLASTYGSNVLVGHDTAGTLFLMSPDEATDDHAAMGDEIKTAFDRRVTAQFVINSGYASVPCYGVQLFGSIGQNAADITSPELNVTLEISDDRGVTWINAGSLTPPADTYSFRLNWQSLGSMEVPGRLFRVTDRGALQRLDGLELEDEGDG
jgi:hypothetical protein